MPTNDAAIFIKPNHCPAHLFQPGSMYMVTGATYHKRPHFNSNEKLSHLQNTLLAECAEFGWELQAWAVLSNHYHFIAQAPTDAQTLRLLVRNIHSKTARWVNAQDRTSGRQVWYQYWDTCLTYRNSYLARLNYVHNNPVKHGLVPIAEAYPWCSMSWFLNHAPEAFCRTVLSMKCDTINVRDEF